MSGSTNTKHHYVYRITNKKLNKHYYGVRSCSYEPANDLGTHYFSSSTDKEFMRDQKEHPENYKYKIVKEFNNRKDAEYYEKFLHEKFNVTVNEHFYNKCKSTLMGFSVEGAKWSDEHHKKMRKVFDSYKRPYEERFGFEKAKKIKEKMKGRKVSDETRRKLSKSMKGKKISDETKEKISNGLYKRYSIKTDEERENFRRKMAEINKSENKRKDDAMKIKALWADPVMRQKLWGNRKSRPIYVIKMTRPDGSLEIFKGFEGMCEGNNFSKYIVRKALKTGKPIEDYSKFSHTDKFVNLTGYKFELLRMESK